MKIFLGIIFLAYITTFNAGATVLKPLHSRQNTIQVTGAGFLEARPDIAVIHMSIVTRAREARDAQTDNAMKSQQLIKTLKVKYNLSEDDIQTTSYTVTAEYKKTQPPTLQGYVVRHSIAVTMRFIDKLGEVLDTAISSGANFIEYIMYESSLQKEYELQALKLAMQEAQAKAQAIAESVGRNIIRVIRVSQGQYFIENEKQEVAEDIDPDTEILPGNIKITATLNVEFLF